MTGGYRHNGGEVRCSDRCFVSLSVIVAALIGGTVGYLGESGGPPSQAVLIAPALATSLMLVALIRRTPSVLVRPSTLVLLVMHARIQWPTVFSTDLVDEWVRNPVEFHLLVHTFMLVASAVAWFLAPMGQSQDDIWAAARRPILEQVPILMWHLRWLVPITVLMAAAYFAVVPFHRTGLATLFTDATGLTDARAESLKLVPYLWLKYMTSWLLNTFAPITLVVGTVLCYRHTGHRVFGASLVGWSLMLLAITGNRAGFVTGPVLIAATITVLNWGSLRRRLPALAAAAVIVLGGMATVTLAREGRELTTENIMTYAGYAGTARIFTVPMRTGLFYSRYAQDHGELGISAIRPLANLYGVDYFHAAREIGQTYVAPESETIISNTNFVFAYRATFGFWSVLASVAMVFLLDLMLPFLRRCLSLALPLVVVLLLKANYLAEAEFTTSLLNGGYFLVPLVAVVGGFLSARYGSRCDAGSPRLPVQLATCAPVQVGPPDAKNSSSNVIAPTSLQ
jgi:hypothetical protein